MITKVGRTLFYSNVEEALVDCFVVRGYTKPKRNIEHNNLPCGTVIGDTELLSFSGNNGRGRGSYVCRCTICADDVVFVQEYGQLVRGVRSCRCSFIKVGETTKKLSNRGWVVLEEGGGRVSDKWLLLCQNNHKRLMIPSNIIHGGYGCQECSGRVNKTLETLSSEISLADKSMLLVKVVDPTLGVLGSVDRVCKTCKTYSNQNIGGILYKGIGCPTCSTSGFKQTKPAHFYIQSLQSESQEILKFGITNTFPEERMKQQQNGSSFKHTLLYSLFLKSGKDIMDIEREVKRLIPRGVVGKDLLPDGHTETCIPSYYNKIIEIINEKQKEYSK